jgi:predicted HAD superfamily Cof-like phosphohydrolase
MSYTPHEDVAKFMKMCGQEVLDSPTIPSKEVLLLRAKLLFEEVKEFIKAAGCYIDEDESGNLEIYVSSSNEPDLVEMYDGLMDINYVSYGACAALGLDPVAGWDEVQRSNMSKAAPDGSIKKNEFGKVIKDPGYSPADLKSIIEGHKK